MIQDLTDPVMNIVGFSGSGKTVFIEKLIPWFKAQGYAPAYLKHSGHTHNFDTQGKDTARQFEAGAVFSSIFSDSQWNFHGRGTIDEIWLQSNAGTDLILLEGYSKSNFPKIVMVHATSGVPDELHWRLIPEDPALVWAYLTDTQQTADVINETTEIQIAFCRDDIDQIGEYLLRRWHWYCLHKTNLNGAVFVGGKSSRMGENKALMDHGKGPHAQFLFHLLSETPGLELVVYSNAQPLFELTGTCVADQFVEKGPMGGLLSLFSYAPNAAWLVLACDLAKLDMELVEFLILNRNPLKLATVLVNPSQQMEPLMAIYEPRIRFAMEQQLLRNRLSLSQCLKVAAIQRVAVPENMQDQLANINTQQERQQVLPR
ncbi:MAG: molybdopterin-guanine dinucleotide biosynthesis protein B [SAR324 cluster bacterium]|nr:molybdopterin-guanine dinucleotide biosynthesis protein B [SAR324 cluster bacterium]